jgi:hypothetical protein
LTQSPRSCTANEMSASPPCLVANRLGCDDQRPATTARHNPTCG